MPAGFPAFDARLRVRERKHPKLYWVDPGLVRAVKEQLGPVAAEEKGPLLEGWVLSLLIAYRDLGELEGEVSYWSPAAAGSVEVDFLLRRGSECLAVEVKAKRSLSRHHFAGLRAVAELPGLARRVLVYLGERRLRTAEGIEVWPLPRFLEALAKGKLWP